jgi:Zn-dependent peptidase ImmA (M78 family)
MANLPISAILDEYSKTPANIKMIAHKYDVPRETIRLILLNNLQPKRYEELKSKKNSQGHVRANLIRYRALHGI